MTTQTELPTALKCETCGGANFRPWLTKEGIDYVHCDSCGLARRSEIPAVEELLKFYEDAARDYYLQSEKMSNDGALDHSQRVAELRPYRKLGRMLDVGCSTGGFLRSAQKDGWECHGVDLSPTVANFCKKDGFQVFGGQLIHAGYPGEYFDVVRFWATLEHTTDPFLCLQESRRILRKGGLLLLSVPSVDSLMVRILGGRYRYICAEHLYYYSRESLKKILTRAGYAGLRIFSDTFDSFTFLEDFKAKSFQSTAHTHEKERRFVEKAKSHWYHKPLKWTYHSILKTMRLLDLGDNWFAYAEK